MSAAIRWNIHYETMPQIVPSAGYSPTYFSFSTPDFDLSLLPESPTQCQSLTFDDTLLCDTFDFIPLKPSDEIKAEPTDEPLHTPIRKVLSKGFFSDDSTIPKQEPPPLIPTTVQLQATATATTPTTTTTTAITTIKQEPDAQVPSDHLLLRSFLRDTSFQRKFHVIKTEQDPMEAKSSEIGDLEPVLDLALQQVRRDVEDTCSVLGIARDPAVWSKDDVKAWLLWTARQFSLSPVDLQQFHVDGATLASFTEEDFLRRAPQGGSSLHAQLEIWKAANFDSRPVAEEATSSASVTKISTNDMIKQQWSPTMASSGSSSAGDFSEDDDEEMEVELNLAGPSTQPDSPDNPSSTKRSSGGSHIHLWQFLKELLASPQQHGTCIRWLDRQRGVFKIEDSVRVARLWGKRKNRPAMNYDKLSRSIRQYYKKGIMRKTERSQRLVYQFCHPYSL